MRFEVKSGKQMFTSNFIAFIDIHFKIACYIINVLFFRNILYEIMRLEVKSEKVMFSLNFMTFIGIHFKIACDFTKVHL